MERVIGARSITLYIGSIMEIKDCIYKNDIKTTKSVLVSDSSNKLIIVPLDKEAYSKANIIIASLGSKQKLSFLWMFNNNIEIMSHPIVGILIACNFNVYLDYNTVNKFNAYKKKMEKFIAPYRFDVPTEYNDLINRDGSKNIFIVKKNELVENKYKNEIHQYYKKLEKLGLTKKKNGFGLFDYQIEDICRLAVKDRAYIAHMQGLGKTAIAVGLGRIKSHKNVLVVAPGAAIGSFTSGWRHEIHRLGVPKDHIHLIEYPEDVPGHPHCRKKYVKDGQPHWFLIDFGGLSKCKEEWKEFSCPICKNPIKIESKGCCDQIYLHRKAGFIFMGSESYKHNFCPDCYSKNGNDLTKARAYWNGSSCNACGFVAKEYSLYKNAIKAIGPNADPRPIYKSISSKHFDVMFIDESHLIKNISSQRSQAVQKINIPNTYIITGTMMSNYIEDTFWQLYKLSINGLFPETPVVSYLSYHADLQSERQNSKIGQRTFLTKYQGTILTNNKSIRISTIKNESEFWRMLSCFMIRRKEDDKKVARAIHLPPVIFHTEIIEMDKQQKVLYDRDSGKWGQDILDAAKTTNDFQTIQNARNLIANMNAMDLQKSLHHLRHICSCPDVSPLYPKNQLTSKDIRLLEIILENKNQNKKTVVFCAYADHILRIFNHLEASGLPSVYITGATSRPERWRIIDDWRTTTKNWVLLTTTGVLGHAVNLTPINPAFDCADVIFATPEWTPSVISQAWKRVHRIGQNKPVTITHLIFKDSIEFEMDQMLEAKRKVIDFAIDRNEHIREGDIQDISLKDIALKILNVNKLLTPNEDKNA